MKRLRLNFIITIFLTFSLLLTTAVPVSAQDYLVERIRSIINDQYVDKVPPLVAEADTVDKMLKALGDPYAAYFTRDEFNQFKDAINQTFVGIGIVFDSTPEGVVIKSVISGSPAQQAGLQIGDILISVNGTSLLNKDTSAAGDLIRGPEGTSIKLLIKRKETVLTKNVVRRSIVIPTVSGRLVSNKVGYICISSFAADTGENFGKIASNLQKQGAQSWILDLRDNGGGYLEAAREVAGYYIPGKTFMLCDSRQTTSRPVDTIINDFQLNGPIVILVNDQTASASEVLTGALQDYGKAVVVGKKTFGKGCVQWLFNLGDDGVFKLTCETYHTPLGREVNKIGITPDLLPTTDYLKMAELILSGQNLTSKQKKTAVMVKGKLYSINLSLANSAAYKTTYTELLRLTKPAGKVAQSKK